jgi:non-homologous end joining protein Ku
MNYAETLPYSNTLRSAVDNKLTPVSYTEKEVLDSIMELAVLREKENQFTAQMTKDVYFMVLYDVITNVLFKKKPTI